MEQAYSQAKLMNPKPGAPLRVHRELNLKGKICRYTFIESMLALEEMENNHVLRIIVDYPPAVCDVPKSLKSEGYDILDVSPINETDWGILVWNRKDILNFILGNTSPGRVTLLVRMRRG